MKHKSVLLTSTAFSVVFVFLAWLAGCSSSSSNTGPSGVGLTGSGGGICAGSCDKSCNQDSDCDTSNGIICCNFGSAKACTSESSCPRFCTNDSTCNTTMGEGCEQVSLASGAQKVCVQAAQGLTTCHADSDCAITGVGGTTTNANNKCCTNYTTPFCTAQNECPVTCKADTDCTGPGEICCQTLGKLEPALASSAQALCIQATSCPEACTQDSDCAGSTQNPLCCDGLCSSTCPKKCSTDNDCTSPQARICCGSTNLLPPSPTLFHVPSCTGIPEATTCASCAEANCACPGCATSGATGVCEGTAYSCSECGELYTCSATSCPDCTPGTTTACTGTTEYTSCASCPSTYCGNSAYGYCPGCVASGGSCVQFESETCAGLSGSSIDCTNAGCTYTGTTCSGTITPCTGLTDETSCSGKFYCEWETTGACTGTITPCSANTSETTCEAEFDCSWTTTNCSGTPQPCGNQTTQTACSSRIGCDWVTGATACTGTIKACSTLAQAQCTMQLGCVWE